MFPEAFAFNHDMCSWNVANVTHMADMSPDAPSFNSDVNVAMKYTFAGASASNSDPSS